jgi:hypothetical protein
VPGVVCRSSLLPVRPDFIGGAVVASLVVRSVTPDVEEAEASTGAARSDEGVGSTAVEAVLAVRRRGAARGAACLGLRPGDASLSPAPGGCGGVRSFDGCGVCLRLVLDVVAHVVWPICPLLVDDNFAV